MELDALYQERILDHFKHPRNREPLVEAEVLATEENSVCGDRVRLAIRLRDGKVEAVRFDGRGCVISTASASMMTEFARGKTPGQLLAEAGAFIGAMQEGGALPGGPDDAIRALEGVRLYPMRVKCATVSWRALQTALQAVKA